MKKRKNKAKRWVTGLGDEDASAQGRYTVQIECIPPELRTDTALADHFNNLFP